MDLSGLGDSPTRPGRTELVEFPADAIEDLGDIRTAAAPRAGADLIFVGLCSGADHAVEAGLHETVASVCVVNPALAYVRWGGTATGASSPTWKPRSGVQRPAIVGFDPACAHAGDGAIGTGADRRRTGSPTLAGGS